MIPAVDFRMTAQYYILLRKWEWGLVLVLCIASKKILLPETSTVTWGGFFYIYTFCRYLATFFALYFFIKPFKLQSTSG